GRDVNQPRARRPGRADRESGGVDVDRDVVLPRGPALHDRGGVYDGAGAARRCLPRRRVGHVADDRLRPEPQDGGATRGPYQRAHRLAPSGEGLDHVTAHEAARTRDENAHAGAAIGKANGSSTTRASRPAARTSEPGSTSRRISARPIQRPAPAAPAASRRAASRAPAAAGAVTWTTNGAPSVARAVSAPSGPTSTRPAAGGTSRPAATATASALGPPKR